MDAVWKGVRASQSRRTVHLPTVSTCTKQPTATLSDDPPSSGRPSKCRSRAVGEVCVMDRDHVIGAVCSVIQTLSPCELSAALVVKLATRATPCDPPSTPASSTPRRRGRLRRGRCRRVSL